MTPTPLARTLRAAVLAAASLSLAAAGTGSALAAEPAPPGGPAIGQYVEDPPAAGGRAPATAKHSKPLPKKVRAKIKGAHTPLGPKLATIASSSQYGAPQKTISPGAATKNKAAKPQSQTPARPTSSRAQAGTPQAAKRGGRTLEQHRSALTAAVSAATGGTSATPLILLGAIVVLTTAAALVAAARRARRSR